MNERRSQLLGGDGWSPDVESLHRLLQRWQDNRPALRSVGADMSFLAVDADADHLADLVLPVLIDRLSDVMALNPRQMQNTRTDLSFLVRYLAAASMVDDVTVVDDFLAWLDAVLACRGVPASVLATSLDVTGEVLATHCPRLAPPARRAALTLRNADDHRDQRRALARTTATAHGA